MVDDNGDGENDINTNPIDGDGEESARTPLPPDPARARFFFESADDIELVYPEPTEELNEYGLPVDGWEVNDGEEAGD